MLGRSQSLPPAISRLESINLPWTALRQTTDRYCCGRFVFLLIQRGGVSTVGVPGLREGDAGVGDAETSRTATGGRGVGTAVGGPGDSSVCSTSTLSALMRLPIANLPLPPHYPAETLTPHRPYYSRQTRCQSAPFGFLPTPVKTEWDIALDLLSPQLLQEGGHGLDVAAEELSGEEGGVVGAGGPGVVAQAVEGPAFEAEGGVEGEQDASGLVVSEALLVDVDAAVEPGTSVHQPHIEAEHLLLR